MSRLAREWWGHVDFVIESGVVFVVATCGGVRAGWLKFGWNVWWSGIALCLSNLREARIFLRLLTG